MIDTQSIEKEMTPSSGSHPKPRTGKKIKFVIGGIIIAAVVVYMIVSAAQGSTAYYMTIKEIETQGPSQRNVRVAGFVVGESIVWEPRELQLTFDVTDDSGTLSVTYNGSRPDMFKDGAETVLEGKYTSQGIFEAETMILKCPSKYQEADQNKETQ
jgi:cytochrome c-type biogenesis protein CcmE